MDTTNALGSVIICLGLIVAAFVIPAVYTWAVKRRFKKLQEAAIQYEIFEYCGSVAQGKSIFNFYKNTLSGQLWYTHKRLDGSRCIESVMCPCEIDDNDIVNLALNNVNKSAGSGGKK